MAAVTRLLTLVDICDSGADALMMSVSARHEAVLADGRRVVLLDDRGWGGTVAVDSAGRWASETVEEMERTARVVVGPDEPPEGRSQAEALGTCLAAQPEDERPTVRQANVVHWAWDIMVGLGTALFLLSAWFGFVWWRRRDLPRTKWFLRAAAVAGVASIVAMEAGWVVTEVGRQPWIVFDYMKVEEAATENDGVWLTFLVICAVYAVVAVSLVLVLRLMARRFAAADEHPDDGGPYAPRTPPRVDAGVS